MRYFICAFGNLRIGVPAESMERIVSLEYEGAQEGGVSLAALCGQRETAAQHGLVLKSDHAVTLLAPKVKTDMELPEAEIRAFPRALAGRFRHFRGVFFNDSDMILVLDPGTIIKDIP